mgnify:CR=1 FL=1
MGPGLRKEKATTGNNFSHPVQAKTPRAAAGFGAAKDSGWGRFDGSPRGSSQKDAQGHNLRGYQTARTQRQVEPTASPLGMADYKKFKKMRDIESKYEFGKMLGKGAFGEVRQCKHKSSGQIFAIKIMRKKDIEKQSIYVELLQNEL